MRSSGRSTRRWCSRTATGPSTSSRPARPRDARRRDPLHRGAQPGAERRPQRAAHRAVGPLPRGAAARPRRCASPGSPSIGAANPLDDVGTARLSRGLADRFVVARARLPAARRGARDRPPPQRRRPRAGLHPFAVDIARASREHADLRHGASVRGAIDYADLLSGYEPTELDLDTLRAPRPAAPTPAGCGSSRRAGRTACQIVHEIIDAILARDYEGSVDVLLEHAAAAPVGDPADSDADGGGPTRATRPRRGLGTGDRPPDEERRPPLARGRDPGPVAAGRRRGGRVALGADGRPRPAGGARRAHRRAPRTSATRTCATPRRSCAPRASSTCGRAQGIPSARRRRPASSCTARTGPTGADGQLDVDATVGAYVAGAATLQREDYKLLEREPHVRHYLILVDHSGSMVGRKLEAGATMAAALAQLSAAGRARYAVLAFDDQVAELKALDEEQDVEDVVERILRLPEGRATDLGKVLRAAAELSDALPEATDAILISDCMPTRGATTFPALRGAGGAGAVALHLPHGGGEPGDPDVPLGAADRPLRVVGPAVGRRRAPGRPSAIPTTSTGWSTSCRPTRHSPAREGRPPEGAMNKIPIHLDVNGVPYDLLVDPGRSLVDVLRDDLGLTGTKRACNEGECASCAVHLDGDRRQLVPRARRPGGRHADHDDRGPRQQRHARPGPAGVRRPLRLAVRLLHAGHDHDRQGAPRRQPQADRGRDPAGDPRQPVPLHWLHEDRRGDPGRVGPARRSASTRPRPRSARRRTVAAARRRAREGHRQGAVRLRHAPARDALRRDPAQPVRARARSPRSTRSRPSRSPA